MDFIDIEELEKKTPEEQIKIKVDIINHNDLSKIPVVYLPDVFVDEYYFISYSHLDYKLVYQDIFDLQSHGLNTWYDRGIPASTNWKDTAKKYITPYACKGVIFYLSRNSIKSDAVKDEIEFVLDTHKPFIVIIIPDEDGNELLPSQLAKQLLDEGLIDNNRYDFIKNAFPDENIYLMYSQPVSNKIEKIKLLPSEPLLRINTNYSRIFFQLGHFDNYDDSVGNINIMISSLNDYYASSILVKDFYDILNYQEIYDLSSEYLNNYDPKNRVTNPKYIQFSLDSAAFINMKNLEYVEIPALNESIITIPNRAFCNCGALKEIKFVHDKDDDYIIRLIDKEAFADCHKLEHFNFYNVVEIADRAFSNCSSLAELKGYIGLHSIGKRAFYKCSSLKDVNLGATTAKISEFAFCNSGVEKVVLPHNLVKLEKGTFTYCKHLKEIVFSLFLESIGNCAFEQCESLSKVVLPETIKTIGESAFASCQALKEFRLPKGIEKIGKGAFKYCHKLTVIDYDGTVEEWKAKNFTNIFDERRRCIIFCSDDNYEYIEN